MCSQKCMRVCVFIRFQMVASVVTLKIDMQTREPSRKKSPSDAKKSHQPQTSENPVEETEKHANSVSTNTLWHWSLLYAFLRSSSMSI